MRRALAATVLACATLGAGALPGPALASSGTRSALDALRARGAIGATEHRRSLRAYARAVAAIERLHGERKRELRGVVADVDAIARRGRLSAGTLPSVVLTLDRNRRWWTRRPIVAVGARLRIGHSQLIWQRYRGHGLQIQWLASFGRANSLRRQGMHRRLRALLDESLELAAPRGPGISWQYLFTYGQSQAPWVSGLAQGTALTALSRSARVLRRPRYLRAAHAALGIFRVPPPIGVRQATPAGAHYLQYSGAPRLRVLNGFVQALNGLSDVNRAAKGTTKARWLLRTGDAQALRELPGYDTGGWSRYSNAGRDSDLGYHRVLRDFLKGRCQRGGNRRFCRFATRFDRDLRRAPRSRIAVAGRRPRAARAARLRVVLDKPAYAVVIIVGERYHTVTRARLSSGGHLIGWRPPRVGRYAAKVTATDLAGNRRSVRTVIRVRPWTRPAHRASR